MNIQMCYCSTDILYLDGLSVIRVLAEHDVSELRDGLGGL